MHDIIVIIKQKVCFNNLREIYYNTKHLER